MVDIAKGLRGATGTSAVSHISQGLLAIAFGSIPASLLYAALRDLWDEEVIGKKANVLALKADHTLPIALIDRMARVGTFGIGSDLVNSAVNQYTSREFSVDSRVFAVNSIVNLVKTLYAIAKQGGTMTWDSSYRPIIQSMGGSGYLQNFDAINNTLNFDNAERRVVARINVGNQLRAVGRELNLDVRSAKGAMGTPNPVKPWVNKMVLAAYANDAREFHASYTRAVEEARAVIISNINSGNLQPTSPHDAVADVAEMYARLHPLKYVFARSPTTAEYQMILAKLGSSAPSVAKAP